MGIPAANFIGTSIGGGILLKLAAFAPERIKRAVFIVPMGMRKTGIGTIANVLVKLAMPSLAYRKAPSEERLQALDPFFESRAEMGEDYVESQRLIYQYTPLIRTAFTSPGKTELKQLSAPCMLIAGEKDILVPAKDIVPEAREKIRNPRKVIVLDKAHTVSLEKRWNRLSTTILEFLGTDDNRPPVSGAQQEGT